MYTTHPHVHHPTQMTKARATEHHVLYPRASRASIHKHGALPLYRPCSPEAVLLGERLEVAVTLVVHSLASREFQSRRTAAY